MVNPHRWTQCVINMFKTPISHQVAHPTLYKQEQRIPQSGKQMFYDRSDEWIANYLASSTLISS